MHIYTLTPTYKYLKKMDHKIHNGNQFKSLLKGKIGARRPEKAGACRERACRGRVQILKVT